MTAFGSATPERFGNAASVPSFPQSGSTWVDSTGCVFVPPGSLDGWWKYRNTLGVVRGDVICMGDSTMYGSGADYSLVQRLRDNATGASSGGPAGFGMIDGGKGIFGNAEAVPGQPILYDAPEVNGWVSQTGTGWTNPDGWDVFDGNFFYTPNAGETVTLQFRTTCARLWYSYRNTAGDFTYSIDGGAPVTVHAHSPTTSTSTIVNRFAYISGLTANTTHTITITNVGNLGGALWCALAPINAQGIVFNKYAGSGDRASDHFWLYTVTGPNYTDEWYDFKCAHAFGRTPSTFQVPPYTTGLVPDPAQPAGGQINPVLAMTNLGFNDLPSGYPAAFWQEYVKRFAGLCKDAGCSGIIIVGQLGYYDPYYGLYGATAYNALKSQALASGLAFVDLMFPLEGVSTPNYTGGGKGPHLTKTQYQAQADFLWNSLLGLRV